MIWTKSKLGLEHKLTLNVKKNKYMLIGSQFKLAQVPNTFNIKADDVPLERKTEYKSLGLLIDQNLTWTSHILLISKKITTGLAILKRLGSILPLETRLCMYRALILPYFDYCSSIWDSTSKGMSDKLQRLQNRSARIIKQKNYETRSKVLLDELGWEKLEYRRTRKLAIIMYKIYTDLSPSYLKDIFTSTTDIHSYNLRNSSSNLHIPRPKSKAGKCTFHYRGSVLWNKIPAEARVQHSTITFKAQLENKDLFSKLIM